MRVLQVGKYFPPRRGGIERVLHELCLGLRDQVDLEVLCFHDTPRSVTDRVDEITVHRMARWETVFSVPIAPGMFFWLRERRFDIIHLHAPNPLAELLYLLSGVEGRMVVTHHADAQKAPGLRGIYQPVARRVLDRARRIVVATPHHHREGTGPHPYEEKVRVIPFGIDLGPFADVPEQEVADTRERFGGEFLLFVGRLVPYKGLRVLMEAMRGVEMPLVIVGTGPFYANLQQLRGGMEDRIHLVGDVEDEELRVLYAAARSLVLPSLDESEAFGLVQIEAFAAGTPVVATSLPTGVSWVNRDGETGLLVPPGDVQALQEALRAMAGDADRAARLGARARERAEELFTRERMATLTRELYEEVLAEDP